MIITKQFITTQWGHYYWGVLYIPDNIGNNKVPLVIFNHGKGESGTTQATTSSLYSNGPLNFIKNSGWKPDFAILAMQEANWSPSATATDYVLSNDVDIKRIWNGTGLFTGLSAGGETVTTFMKDFSTKYPGFTYVPMSPAGGSAMNDSAKLRRVWAFSGNTDGSFTDTARGIVSQIPNARLTIYNGGHCCWNNYYNPNYKETINGKSVNIYEWGLTPVAPPIEKFIQKVTVEYRKVIIEYSTGEKVEII